MSRQEEIDQNYEDVLSDIKTGFESLNEMLKKAQPERKSGSISIRLEACGNPKCRTCPHPRFVVWKSRIAKTGKTKGVSFMVAHRIKHPTRCAAYSDPKIAKLIDAGVDLFKIRERAIAAKKSFNRSLYNAKVALNKYRF